jgi:hypothetical protein
MAGFNFLAGRSNNMVLAESQGKITIGRWGKRYKVSAAAVMRIMCPTEAHHTGTGYRGKSRLTYVIHGETVPTEEQLERMRKFDADRRAAKAYLAERLAPSQDTKAEQHFENCVARFKVFPSFPSRDRRPFEKFVRLETVKIHCDGKIVAKELGYAAATPGWHRRSGLMIMDAAGEIVAERNIFIEYDDAVEIAASLRKMLREEDSENLA